GRAMALPLLAEGMTHDWNFILGNLGLLYAAESLGRLTFGLGALAMLAALALLGWDAWARVLSSETPNRPSLPSIQLPSMALCSMLSWNRCWSPMPTAGSRS